ncbi:MAG: DUF4270 domain-containing protein [Bacteroidota bacterium]
MRTIFFKSLLLLVSIVFFSSCDKDYNEVGDALIGENHFDLTSSKYNVTSYNEKTGPVQSNNLPVNALGIYDNTAFGKTTASFATELVLATENPTIGANAQIENVYLDIPYFVDGTQTKPIDAGAGGNTYVLDSIYGSPTAKIKLSIYESGRYMGKQNGVTQLFYTNQNAEFDGFKIGNRLNDDASQAQNDAFFFDSAQHVFTTTDDAGKVTKTYSAPGMRLKLNDVFFKNKILNAPAGKLATNDVFRQYFKGLYFKVEQSGSDPGSLAMINFGSGTITINYKEDSGTNDNPTRVAKSIVLNMKSLNTTLPVNTVSLLEQTNENSVYTNAINSPDRTNGDDKLYLKGGEGSLAVLELFDKTDVIGYDENGVLTTGPNGVSDELDDIRKNKWLINEANLVFNIDADDAEFQKSYEPNRIYLYDFNNNRPILDYYLDGSSAIRPKFAKYVFGGTIKRDPNSVKTPKRGLTYKIRITNHIRSLVKYADSTNIKLGIAVTEDISIANSYKVRTPTSFLSQAPAASVMNPLGTIIYGGKSTVPDEKRLKLEIYYTKPKP